MSSFFNGTCRILLLCLYRAVAGEKWSQEACLQVANRLPAIAAVLCCSDMKKYINVKCYCVSVSCDLCVRTWNSSSNQLFYQTCAVHLPDSPQQGQYTMIQLLSILRLAAQ